MKKKRALVVALAATPFLLAACGGRAGGPAVASPGGGAAASGDPAKYASCLRDHGLTVVQNDNELSVRGSDPETGRKAEEACKRYAPVLPGLSADEKKKMLDRALRYAACVRKHGMDMPDPQLDSRGGVRITAPDGVGKDSPAFQAAQKACQALLAPDQR
ncbi:hypothetical protein JOL79_26995 [Microbispora sp. RL4-1S]|uniref:DUF732 domain-containing protein n=1 Tax=Microbispora oryzae TaxID=2806554 RepID=A0A940WPZ6_9ACTN|nr:hypothetical protein [Microbispora oryzae]MBP2707437.1 hypothetical protein [Microbispora oryzae]